MEYLHFQLESVIILPGEPLLRMLIIKMFTTRLSEIIQERYNICLKINGMILGKGNRCLKLEEDKILRKFSIILIEEL